MMVYVIYNNDFVKVFVTSKALREYMSTMLGIITINHKHLSEVGWWVLDKELESEEVVCHQIDLFSEIISKFYLVKTNIIEDIDK